MEMENEFNAGNDDCVSRNVFGGGAGILEASFRRIHAGARSPMRRLFQIEMFFD
jgi:hypothetical protein